MTHKSALLSTCGGEGEAGGGAMFTPVQTDRSLEISISKSSQLFGADRASLSTTVQNTDLPCDSKVAGPAELYWWLKDLKLLCGI